MEQKLLEQEELRRQQQEKIEHLTKLILVSSKVENKKIV